MIEEGWPSRDLAALVVPLIGGLVETGDRYEPYRVLDESGTAVEPVAAFFCDLLAAGRAESTVRSYGMDLLRWFRFLWAIEIPWDQATRVEARDFSQWMQVAGKQPRPHWRTRRQSGVESSATASGGYAPSVCAHSETVLRAFYDFHQSVGTGPIINPFPLHRSRRGGRANAHHNPMEPFRNERSGLYRPRVPKQDPAQRAG
ncbi:site-specific integrase [Nonomuraea sp. B10E15]|uniref:site-specific integrase n=1 Tax=Nonomuraea sp. B10E15 TaxID=3153560 RepID=UPI00325F2C78